MKIVQIGWVKSGSSTLYKALMELGFIPTPIDDANGDEAYEKLDEYNFDFGQELLNRDEVRETLGTEKYIGGLKINYNGHLHPLNLCIGEADAASDLGD